MKRGKCEIPVGSSSHCWRKDSQIINFNLLNHCVFCLRKISSSTVQEGHHQDTKKCVRNNSIRKSKSQKSFKDSNFSNDNISNSDATVKVVPKFEQSPSCPLMNPQRFRKWVWHYLVRKNANQGDEDLLPQFKFWMGADVNMDTFCEIPPMCTFCGSKVEQMYKLAGELEQFIHEIRMIIQSTGKSGTDSERHSKFEEELRMSLQADKYALDSTLQFLSWLEEFCVDENRDANIVPGQKTSMASNFVNLSTISKPQQKKEVAVNTEESIDWCSNNFGNSVNDKEELENFVCDDVKTEFEEESTDTQNPLNDDLEMEMEEDDEMKCALLDTELEDQKTSSPSNLLMEAVSVQEKVKRKGGRPPKPKPPKVEKNDPPQRCDFCRLYIPQKEIINHMKDHVGDYLHVCPRPSCGKVFSCRYRLTRLHLKENTECWKYAMSHNEKNLGREKTCDTCGFQTKLLRTFRIHLLNEHNTSSKPFQCPVASCTERFSVRQSVEIHLVSHTYFLETASQTCTLCNDKGYQKKVFQTKEMITHLKKEHGIKDIIGCKHCFYKFSCREHLLDHLYFHVRKGDALACDICDTEERFSRIVHLREHCFMEHNIGTTFICEHCCKIFWTIANLNSHMSSAHTNPKSWEKKYFECDQCMEGTTKFSSKEALMQHKVEVHGADPYSCKICQEKFTKRSVLYRHELEHKGVKTNREFRCDIEGCGKVLGSKKSLELHKSSVEHLGRTNKFMCDLCGKGFNHAERLKEHRDKVHFGTRVVCDQCGESFAGQKALQTHKLIHTGERPYQCLICHQRFRHSSVLRIHERSHEKKGDSFKPKGPMKNVRKRRKLE